MNANENKKLPILRKIKASWQNKKKYVYKNILHSKNSEAKLKTYYFIEDMALKIIFTSNP